MSHGQGGYVFDADGKQYIDGSGGPAVYSIGYGNEEVIAAIFAAVQSVLFEQFVAGAQKPSPPPNGATPRKQPRPLFKS